MSKLNEETRRRVVDFFRQRGYRPRSGDSDDLGEVCDLSLMDGRSVLAAKILEGPGLQSRNAVLAAGLAAQDLAARANQVYLVLPKLQASIVDASIFQERGLGLLVYDERSMEEAVAARRFAHTSNQVDSSPDIERMKSRIAMLEKTVDKLASELSTIRTQHIESPRPALHPQPTDLQREEPSALPSFIRNNPWVDILSRRGREPEHIAA